MCEDMPKRFTITEKWDNPDFRRLSPDAKLLFLYICDRCDMAGFWEIDIDHASFATRIAFDDIPTVLVELGNCCLTVTKRLLWVKNFVPYQGNWPLQENVGAHRAILQSLKLHNGFRDKALEHWAKKTGVTLTKGLPNPSSISISISKGLGPRGVLGGKKKTTPDPGFIDEFESEFWPNVPVKIGKGAARDAYIKARKKASKEEIIAGLPKFKDYEAGRSKQADYRPLHPATWLNQERWEDEVEHKETIGEQLARIEREGRV